MFSKISLFLRDPTTVGNLISSSYAFSKPSLYTWKSSVHVLLKHSLKGFQHNLTSEMSAIATLAWTFFDIDLLLGWSENWLFPVQGHCWVFQICWHVEYSTLTASSFRIWDRSAGILSPPLALFIVMLPKAQLSSHSRASSFRWVTTASWFSRSLSPFLYSSCVVLSCLLDLFCFC